jgi:hypothetical protein
VTFHVANLAMEHVVHSSEAPPTVSLRTARRVAAPAIDHEGIIDLKRELLSVLRSDDARRIIAEIVRETLDEREPGEDAFLDAGAAAEMLSMTPAAVRKAALRGSLPCRRLGRKLRFLRSELLSAAKQ